MCGLAGVFSGRAGDPDDQRRLLMRMADSIVHRGPDDAGVWCDATLGIGFAFRRLAILDLTEAGHQPMSSASGRYTVVFNGELYNHREVRASLRRDPKNYRGHSDTETLLAAIDERGLDRAISSFTGMFAIAIWDRAEQSLTLVRDRIGKKPMYYFQDGVHVVFGSELRALLCHPACPREVDAAALAGYLSQLYVAGSQSILAGVQRVAPGTMVTFQRGGDHQARRYWTPPSAQDVGPEGSSAATDDQRTEELAELLDDAVKSRMLSDVPIGALLSGGIDSSLVVALMARHSGKPVHTFSVRVNQQGYDESGYAADVAAHLGTAHTTFDLSTDALVRAAQTVADVFDEPLADPSQIPTYLICEHARRAVTVVLTGDGGDELFGGYNRYVFGARLLGSLTYVPLRIRGLTADLVGSSLVHKLLRTVGIGSSQQSASVYGDKIRRLANSTSMEHMYAELLSNGAPVHDLLPAASTTRRSQNAPRRRVSSSTADWMMATDQSNYLPDDLLAKLDRASMAVSLEARSPLLDHRVLEFSWRLPPRMKLNARRGKLVLRSLLARHLPDALFDRPKMGFSVPIATWLRGPLKAWAAERILAADPSQLLDAGSTMRLWNRLQGGDDSVGLQLWAIVVYRSWQDRWLIR